MSGNGPLNVVLVGRMGNGKSATANTILGEHAFKARKGPSSVTLTTQVQSSVMDNGQTINVIDTPGLFDTQFSHEYIVKEIVKCMDLAKNGIHALLLVYTVRTRFSKEEEAALHIMMDVFGPKITDYMVVVLTGADELEKHDDDEDEITPEQFVKKSPESFKKILELCKKHHVFFDNRTKDPSKIKKQKDKLLAMVNSVLHINHNKPFTNDLMIKMQENVDKPEVYEEVLNQAMNKVKSNLRESMQNLEQRLANELKARTNAEEELQRTKREWAHEKEMMHREQQGGQFYTPRQNAPTPYPGQPSIGFPNNPAGYSPTVSIQLPPCSMM